MLFNKYKIHHNLLKWKLNIKNTTKDNFLQSFFAMFNIKKILFGKGILLKKKRIFIRRTFF